mmetsp:Transcript_37993/g.45840  ORF Transcript_37993/g.45840 Transcript_37993/m.45840 type:complete len:374 (+) Transcript_37993:63-1184(+)
MARMSKALNKSVVVCLRELYLDAVKAHYWELIEDKMIPPGKFSEILLKAIDLAKEKVEQGIRDWDYVAPYVRPSSMFSWFTPATLIKICRNWEHRRAIKDYNSWSTACYVASSFAEAHIKAIRHVKENYTDLDAEGSEIVILEEEHYATLRHAELFLEQAIRQRKNVMQEIRTRQFASLLLAKQTQHLHNRTKEGLLTERMSEQLVAECEAAFEVAHLTLASIEDMNLVPQQIDTVTPTHSAKKSSSGKKSDQTVLHGEDSLQLVKEEPRPHHDGKLKQHLLRSKSAPEKDKLANLQPLRTEVSSLNSSPAKTSPTKTEPAGGEVGSGGNGTVLTAANGLPLSADGEDVRAEVTGRGARKSEELELVDVGPSS